MRKLAHLKQHSFRRKLLKQFQTEAIFPVLDKNAFRPFQTETQQTRFKLKHPINTET